jgi:hypothetical protein
MFEGFKIVYGGSNDDTFTTFKIGEDITTEHRHQLCVWCSSTNYRYLC